MSKEKASEPMNPCVIKWKSYDEQLTDFEIFRRLFEVALDDTVQSCWDQIRHLVHAHDSDKCIKTMSPISRIHREIKRGIEELRDHLYDTTITHPPKTF